MLPLSEEQNADAAQVSTQGWKFATVIGGQTKLESGTSASAPTFAGVVALVNDALFAAGRPALGWLNPWLYANGSQAFTDVTVGKNPGYTCNDTAVSSACAMEWRGADNAVGCVRGRAGVGPSVRYVLKALNSTSC